MIDDLQLSMRILEELCKVVLLLDLAPARGEYAAKVSVAVSLEADDLAVAVLAVHLPVCGVFAGAGRVEGDGAVGAAVAGAVEQAV
jgi:hypothetical protein